LRTKGPGRFCALAALRERCDTSTSRGRSEIEECADADASRMQARLTYVPIGSLPGYTGKRMLVRA